VVSSRGILQEVAFRFRVERGVRILALSRVRVHRPTRFVSVDMFEGLAIAQAVSRRLPSPAAWVRAQVRSRGICGQSGAGVGFLRVLLFPLAIFIPPAAPYSFITLSSTLYSIDSDSVVM
jgi:hypothetical protein